MFYYVWMNEDVCSVRNACKANRTKWKLNIAWPARVWSVIHFIACDIWMNRCKNSSQKQRRTENFLSSILQYVILHVPAFKNRAIAISIVCEHGDLCRCVCMCICLNWRLVGLIQLFKHCSTRHVNGLSIRLFEDRMLCCFTDSAIFGMYSIRFLSIGTCYWHSYVIEAYSRLFMQLSVFDENKTIWQ